jgi:hypothetical protein
MAGKEKTQASETAEQTTDISAQTESAEVGKQEDNKIAGHLRQQRKVKILIPSGRGPGERAPVPVAINGCEFLIVRDKAVEVPESVVHALDLAVENVAESTVDSHGREKVHFVQAPRFPYRVIA